MDNSNNSQQPQQRSNSLSEVLADLNIENVLLDNQSIQAVSDYPNNTQFVPSLSSQNNYQSNVENNYLEEQTPLNINLSNTTQQLPYFHNTQSVIPMHIRSDTQMEVYLSNQSNVGELQNKSERLSEILAKLNNENALFETVSSSQVESYDYSDTRFITSVQSSFQTNVENALLETQKPFTLSSQLPEFHNTQPVITNIGDIYTPDFTISDSDLKAASTSSSYFVVEPQSTFTATGRQNQTQLEINSIFDSNYQRLSCPAFNPFPQSNCPFILNDYSNLNDINEPSMSTQIVTHEVRISRRSMPSINSQSNEPKNQMTQSQSVPNMTPKRKKAVTGNKKELMAKIAEMREEERLKNNKSEVSLLLNEIFEIKESFRSNGVEVQVPDFSKDEAK